MIKHRLDNGLIYYDISAAETKLWGGLGICDSCGEAAIRGYLVPVLNYYLCPTCFKDWASRAVHYPEDDEVEASTAAYYERLIPCTEQEDEKEHNMITIPEYDKVLNGEMTYQALNPYGVLFSAYRNTKACKNELLDFNEVIWESGMDTMVNFFAEHDITEFTISSTFSGLPKVLGMFEERGFKITGTTKVNAPYTDWETGELARIYAVHLKRGEE